METHRDLALFLQQFAAGVPVKRIVAGEADRGAVKRLDRIGGVPVQRKELLVADRAVRHSQRPLMLA